MNGYNFLFSEHRRERAFQSAFYFPEGQKNSTSTLLHSLSAIGLKGKTLLFGRTFELGREFF